MDRSNPRHTAALIGLCLVAAFLYLPFLGHPFQYDDQHTIVENPALRQPDAWVRALAGTMRSSGEVLSGHYRPLTYLTYWITLRIAGPSPTAFHAVNLALHLLTTGLFLLLVRDLVRDRRVAILAAALFALHPAVSEAVLYASARATLLSSFCVLAALVCYLRARQHQAAGDSSAGWWTGWAVASLAALLAKETSVVLPLLCLAMDSTMQIRDRRIGGRATWAPHLAAFGAILAFVLWLGLWRHMTAALTAPDRVSHYAGVVIQQISAIVMAVRLFVLPWPLAVDHLLPVWPEPGAVLPVLLVAGWCVFGLIAFCSRVPMRRRAGFFALWVLVVALPTTLWPLNVPFQEHRAYLQHAALAALAALGMIHLIDTQRVGRTAAAVAGAAALTVGSWLIIQQGLRWGDPVQLWDHARRTAPTSFRSHTNAGLALAAAGRWDDAGSALAAALTLNPDYPPALVARGVTAQRRGDRAAAATDYKRAAALRPEYVPALFNLGLLAQEAHDPASAEQWYRRVLTINPLHADTLLNLGVLLLSQHRIAEAAPLFVTARSVSPPAPEVLYYSGILAEARGHAPDALAYYRLARQTALAGNRDALARDAQARLSALEAQRRSTPSDEQPPVGVN